MTSLRRDRRRCHVCPVAVVDRLAQADAANRSERRSMIWAAGLAWTWAHDRQCNDSRAALRPMGQVRVVQMLTSTAGAAVKGARCDTTVRTKRLLPLAPRKA